MNEILKRLDVEEKHNLMRDDFFIHDIRVEETGNERPFTLDRCTEYELSVKCGVRFWANKVQKPDAQKAATEALVDQMFADFRAVVKRGISQTYNGDREGVLDALHTLLDMTEVKP